MDPSAYALVHGLRRTRGTLEAWRTRPVAVLRGWVGQSLAVAALLLVATWVIALTAVLAATFVTSAIALPVLVVAALWEVYGAPRLVSALV